MCLTNHERREGRGGTSSPQAPPTSSSIDLKVKILTWKSEGSSRFSLVAFPLKTLCKSDPGTKMSRRRFSRIDFHFFPGSISKGFPLKTRIMKIEIGPSKKASLSDRSRSTSAGPGRRWCLRGPRGARGLSDPSYTSNSWRCGDATVACRDASCDCHISARNSSEGWILVLFAIQDLRCIFFPFRLMP